MPHEACESSNLIQFVPFPSVGIAGAEDLVMSYFIVLLLFRGKFEYPSVPVPIIPINF